MGLLSFTKKSRKQGSKPSPTSFSHAGNNNQIFSLTSHSPMHNEDDENDYSSFVIPNRKSNLIESPKQVVETSLMDDIMNELESTKSIKENTRKSAPDNSIYQSNINANSNTTVTKQNNNIKRGN